MIRSDVGYIPFSLGNEIVTHLLFSQQDSDMIAFNIKLGIYAWHDQFVYMKITNY